MKHNLLRIDWKLITPVLVLVTIGLTTLFSISPTFFTDQLLYVLVSLAIFFFFSQIDFRMLTAFKIPIYFLSILCLGVVLVLGFESRGAMRWIDVFGVSIQFSELFKPLLSISLAAFLVENERTSLKSYLLTGLLLLPVFALIYLQPDLGNALIYAGVALVTLLVYGFPLLWFFITFLPVVIISPFMWLVLHDYQRQRIMTFFNPASDPTGSSYNVIQAVIAVGSGMLIGKGFSEGTQSGLRFLPERHTDFIFATLSEGLGFIGAMLVIICFGFLCYHIYTIFRDTDSPFGKIFAVCAFGFILVHFFVNIGMNIGLLPIVGVTLPFVSFGGSSLLSNFVFLGILSSISTAIKRKQVLEIR